MSTSTFEFDASRRFAMKSGVLVAAGVATEAAHAFEPVTTTALVIAGLKLLGGLAVGAGMISLANATDRKAYQDRNARSPGFHDETGPNHELKPEFRDQPIPLPDGGLILCADGLYRPRPPRAGAPGPYSDLSVPELELCGTFAPYPGGPRVQPADPATESRRRLDALEKLFDEPLHRMRYARRMMDTKGKPYVLYSALARNRKAELLRLVDTSGPKPRVVERYESPSWTLEGAKDLRV